MYIKLKQKYIICLIIVLLGYPLFTFAETLSGSNYNIENPSVDQGGEISSSTNYTSRESVGDANGEGLNSTNYKAFPGFEQHAAPGVPAQPTFTNTGGTLYNALDFVVATGDGQQSDVQYAIAISSDDFVTTNFIQTDDTVGSSEAWQTYTQWGNGTGERVTGLLSSTSYKIKVKARFAADTETAYSVTAQAATVGASLTIVFAGINSGTTFDGETTTITTTANGVAYGTLVVSTPTIAAHQVTVTTNASGGFTTTVRQDGNLRTITSAEISTVPGTNASPSSWPGSITTGRFGYHSSDEDLCTGSATRFSTNNTWAALDTVPYEVGCNMSPVPSGETTTVTYKLEVGGLQDSGQYANVITYITSAQF